MLQFFSENYRIVTDVMLREYFQHELEPRHFFEETMDPLSNIIIGLTVRKFQSRCLVRDLVSVWPDTTRLMRMDDLRWHVVSMLINAGLMNVRFRTYESENDGSA